MPEPKRSIPARAGQQALVGMERKADRGALMTFEGRATPTGLRIPHIHAIIRTAGSHQLAAGMPGEPMDAADGARMAQRLNHCISVQVTNLHQGRGGFDHGQLSAVGSKEERVGLTRHRQAPGFATRGQVVNLNRPIGEADDHGSVIRAKVHGKAVNAQRFVPDGLAPVQVPDL